MRTTHSLADGGDCFFLADNTLVQDLFETEQARAVFFGELGHRHA